MEMLNKLAIESYSPQRNSKASFYHDLISTIDDIKETIRRKEQRINTHEIRKEQIFESIAQSSTATSLHVLRRVDAGKNSFWIVRRRKL